MGQVISFKGDHTFFISWINKNLYIKKIIIANTNYCILSQKDNTLHVQRYCIPGNKLDGVAPLITDPPPLKLHQ